MLEVKNVTKVYKGKKTQDVRALDNVNVAFPETGLVFLLGKSGSGKSTLLNVVGGLDAFDSGEIIIKGKSSNSFKEKDFDSYRNTYVGFIFQEYNILNEFSVEKNIALALELQGKQASKEIVNQILEQVDLSGYGKRKPNQLSGGQKQRVAIARALIKDPQIIMADEPTGALDSNTGKQVFDTLKKLSATRLIIVVSHDREFAESYADRIIEMKDGKVFTDVTKRTHPAQQVSSGFKVSGNTIFIEPNHNFTAAEKLYFNKLLDSNREHGLVVSFDKDVNKNFKKFAKMDDQGNREYFDNTRKEDIKENHRGDDLKLIKSRFKFSDSFKMGASGLKTKKIRLVITILLAAVALTMFGVADTMASFSSAKSMYDSIQAAETTNIGIVKRQAIHRTSSWDDSEYTEMLTVNSDEADLDNLKEQFPHHSFVGARNLPFSYAYPNYHGSTNSNYFYYMSLSSLFDFNAADYETFGLTLLAGNYPTQDTHVAITDYHLECYKKLKYKDGTENGLTITSAQQLIGKEFIIDGFPQTFTISGVINTGFDVDRYAPLLEANSYDIETYMLSSEMQGVLEYGFGNSLYFNEGAYARFAGNSKTFPTNNMYFYLDYDYYYDTLGNMPEQNVHNISFVGDEKDINFNNVVFYDSTKTSLGPNEVIVSPDIYFNNNVFNIYQYDNRIEFSVYSYSREEFVANEEWLLTEPDLEAKLKQKLTEVIRQYFFTNNQPAPLDITNYQTYTDIPAKIVGYYLDIEGFIAGTADTYTAWLSTELMEEMKSLFAPYKSIITPLTGVESQDYPLIEYISNFAALEDGFLIKNQFSSVFENFVAMIEMMAQIFLYIGIGFAVFSAIMMMNFITITISYKKREIGILRAIGARRSDVYGIFFNESLIITTINYTLALIFTFVAVMVLNTEIVKQLGLSVILLSFGLRQVVLLAGISLLVAAVASFLPVRKISKMKPIDAIQNRK